MVETVVTVERTQTTQQTSAPAGGGGLSALRINVGYFKTVPGIIKLVQFIFGIICMALASPAYIAATSFFLFVAIITFIGTILWIFLYFLGLREAFINAINWILPFLGIICMALASPSYTGATSFFLFVVVVAFIATVLWIFAYLLGIREALNVAVNWIFTLLGIICMVLSTPSYISATLFFKLVSLVGFITTTIWFFIYFLNIRQVHPLAVNWRFVELINTGVIALLCFIAFVLQLAQWSSYPYNDRYSINIAAGVFGLFNFLAFAAGTYFLFMEHKNRTIH